MDDFPFKIGDRVEKNGVSGIIIAKFWSGFDWILKVRLAKGSNISWNSGQVRHCPIEPQEEE